MSTEESKLGMSSVLNFCISIFPVNFMDQEAEGEFDPSILTTQQTTGTSIILAQIQPSTTYAIAITAETRAGEGDLIEIVVTTCMYYFIFVIIIVVIINNMLSSSL